MEIFDKIRQIFLVVYLSLWIGGRDDPVQWGETILITMVIFEDNAIEDNVMSRDARNEHSCGICFWTKRENAYTSRPWIQFTKIWNL